MRNLLQILKDSVCKALEVVQSSLHSLQLESAGANNGSCVAGNEGGNTPCSSRITGRISSPLPKRLRLESVETDRSCNEGGQSPSVLVCKLKLYACMVVS